MNGYKRKPIVLSKQVIMLLQIFKRYDNVFEDMWIDDYIRDEQKYGDYAKDAASQLIHQLEGHECGAFIKALAKECFGELSYHDKKYGTDWCHETIDAVIAKYVRERQCTPQKD